MIHIKKRFAKASITIAYGYPQPINLKCLDMNELRIMRFIEKRWFITFLSNQAYISCPTDTAVDLQLRKEPYLRNGIS